MKIASSQLSFSAEKKYEERDISRRSVETIEDKIPLSKITKMQSPAKKLRVDPASFLTGGNVSGGESVGEDMPSDPKLASMKRMLETMMGKKLRIVDISAFQRGASQQLGLSGSNQLKNGNQLTSGAAAGELPEIPARKIRITDFNSHYESEATTFNASGSIKTETGEAINFDLRLDMKREFYSENQTQFTTSAVMTDPLVINFGGGAAELSDVKFKFDLDSDGTEEELPWLSSGSGFLVLDRNQDGVINNGSEMFGPTTNNGFSELAQLDDDGNGWIDENDSAFEKLSVWSGTTPENSTMKSLKEAGIGAISLSSADTEFTVKEQSSQKTLGQIRKTGIYLEENGKAGTIQQLDLAI